MPGLLMRDTNSRHFVILFSILICCVIAGLIFLTFDTIRDLNSELLRKEIATYGILLANSPGLENNLPSFLGEATEEEFAIGLKALAVYGYDPGLDFNHNPPVMAAFKKLIMYSVVILIGGFAIAVMLLLIFTDGLSRKLQEIALGADCIMNGRYGYRLPEEGEGDIAIVGSQFNQMAKRLEMTLEELNGQKENMKNFVSDMTHQLKTPLAALKTMNELLLNGAHEKPDIRNEFLRRSMEQIERMEWLVKTLLKITRLETGVIKFNLKKTLLKPMLAELIDGLLPRIASKDQNLEFDVPESAFILCDSDWLGQAVQNILKNAIDYTPNGGMLGVTITESEGFVKIGIKDSGIGIEPDELPMIFDRFYRGRSEMKGSGGTGIGLSLAKAIVEKHGGLINVRSVRGIGSTFTIELPKE